MLKKLIKYFFVFILMALSFSVQASMTDGTIDPSYPYALLCQDGTCTTTSRINFKTTQGSPIHITDTSVTGNAWSETFGWINFSPTQAGVTNTSNGVLGGYAWGSLSGWINFAPTQGGVTVNSSGQLSGYAWAQNYGWIKFNCAITNACVATDWRPLSVRNGSTGGGGGGGTPKTFCELNPTDPSCVAPPTQTFCELHPSDPSCVTPPVSTFCQLHPTDVSCVVPPTQTFCDLHPSDPSCVVPPVSTFCQLHPTDVSCVIVPTPTFCEINPSDPSCIVPPAQTFCELHPTDVSCIVPPTPTFCEINPTDPSCIVPPAQTFCELHPSDPSCVLPPTPSLCESNPTDPSCVSTTPIVSTIVKNVSDIINSIFGGGDNGNNNQNGPTPTQITVKKISKGISDGAKVTAKAVNKSVEKTSEVVNTPVGSISTKTVATTGVIMGSYLSIASVLFSNPLTFSELFLIPFRLWSLLLIAFGIKRRNTPWGTVYDSITKQPLDPAYVVLQDLDGNEIATSITDLDGRYGFLVPMGKYRLLANKTNYVFPSKKLSGKTSDELYQDLYFSEIIEIKEDGGVINKNIPMDPLKFDWNEFAKRDQKLMKFFSKRDLWIARISNIFFVVGFIVSLAALFISPSYYNLAIFVLYIILLLLKNTIMKPRPFGNISKKENEVPLPFAIMRVFFSGTDKEVIHKVTDKAGKYYCLVPNGLYYVRVDNKNPDESYTTVHTSEPIEVKNGYINNKFKI